jgi:nucleotide-binding universal stress UspA family protein
MGCWKKAAAAARAIAAAMPLQVNAKQVLLAGAKERHRSLGDGLADLSSQPVWHGISVKTIFMLSVAGPVGEVLMAAARAHHADMLVMGAYGHGRMRKSSSAALPSQSLNRLKLRSF